MAVAWESASTDILSATSDLSLDPAVPSGLQAGELLLAFGGCADSRTLTPPTANGTWTQLLNDTNGSYRQYVWSKVATSGDLSSLGSWAVNGTSGNAHLSAHRISGASGNAPTVASGTGTNSTTQTCPDVNAPSAGCLVFWVLNHSSAGSGATANKGTERVDLGTAVGGMQAVYTNVEPSAGTITGATITTTGTFGAKRLASVSVEAAGGGGSIIPLVQYHRQMQGIA